MLHRSVIYKQAHSFQSITELGGWCVAVLVMLYRLTLDYLSDLHTHWLSFLFLLLLVFWFVAMSVKLCEWLRLSTYSDLCVPRVARDRYGQRAFAVYAPHLWNQLPAATRATCTDTPDCFKQSMNASLFSWVGVMLQITAPLKNFLKGGYSNVYNINVKYTLNSSYCIML